MQNETVRVAFVGAGYMASEHIKAFADIKGVQLCAITSRSRERAEALARQYEIPVVADSVDELFERSNAHLVVVSVPELSTLPVCQQVFKYPWKSLIEKPVGYDINNASEILTLARQHKHVGFVALNRRHYSSTQTVLEDLQQSHAPRLITVIDQQDQIAALKAGQPELVVKNWMYANSIHLIDYFAILGRGKITKIDPIVRWNAKEPAFVVAKVTYDSGDIGIYQATWNGPGPWMVTVATKEKRWELRPLELASMQIYGSRSLEQTQVHEWDKSFKPGIRRQAEEAIGAIRGDSHSLPTLDDAFLSMKLVESIYREN